MAEIKTREPELFTSGDSLVFKRYLPGYLPADGWSLLYTFTAPDGQFLRAIASATSGDSHLIDEDNVSFESYGLALPLDFVLTGFALKGTERHQIFVGNLRVNPNTGDTTDEDNTDLTEPTLTEAQQMLEIISKSLKDAYAVVYQEVNLSGSKVVWANISKLREDLAYWKEVRRNEIAMERARAGKPTGLVTVPVFQIG